jgi:2-dehydro-3-deoxyglucarate aldolase/4-hydroxy-2-oxoheptanedioate aldolase
VSALRRRLLAGDALFGMFLGLGSALAAEACALGGFDWLLVDLEHGCGDESTFLQQQLAADAHGVPMLARVESSERIRAGRVLDLGAAGVMVPRLNTAAEAREAVRHMRYSPAGDRGVATYNRSCEFGLRPENLRAEPGLCVVQVESRQALDEVDAIAAVDGVDVLFVGPRDLSHDLGVPGDTSSAAFQRALKRVVATGIPAGILAPDAATARRYADEGFRFVGVGSDAALLASSGRRLVAELGVSRARSAVDSGYAV